MFNSALRKLPFFAACCLLFTACSKDVIFEKTIKIPDASWRYENVLPFEFEVADTTNVPQALLEVNHAGDFGFQNSYVQITTKFPGGEEKKQHISLELAAQSGMHRNGCLKTIMGIVTTSPDIHRVTLRRAVI